MHLREKVSPIIDSRQQEEQMFLKRMELTNIFKLYFDFTYYLGASPFRFVMDVGNGYFYAKVWKPQQCICATLHFLSLFKLLSEIRERLPNEWSSLKADPASYFLIAMGICGGIYKLVTKLNFWMNREQFLKIVNFILKEKHLPVRSKWVTKPYFLYTLFSFHVIKITLCFAIGYRFVIPVWRWSPSWWLRRFVAQTRFVFCFASKLKPEEAPLLTEITLWDAVLMVPMLMAQLERWIVGEFFELCILSAVLTHWIPASAFASGIKDILRTEEEWDEQAGNGDLPNIIIVRGGSANQHKARQNRHPWQLIYRNFQAIQSLSEIINGAIGSQVTWYMAQGLMYYSINLNTVILTHDEYKRFHKVVFYVLTFIILYMSADICTKLESAKQWLVRNNNIKAVPSDEANLVLHEVITKDIGIRGSNVFTLTFPLVTGFLSLIVTFFVICVQQNSNSTSID